MLAEFLEILNEWLDMVLNSCRILSGEMPSVTLKYSVQTYIHALLTTPYWGFSEPMKQTTEKNLTD